MDLKAKLAELQEKAEITGRKLESVPLLLSRVTLGGLFLSTGWGKLHSLDKLTSYFVELHIAMPAFNATLVAYSEFLCGTLLLLGLVSRLATVPLLVSMVVALLTAKKGEIHGFTDLFGEVEFTYIVLLVVVAVFGPGAFALDAFIARSLASKRGAGATDVVPGGSARRGA
jgi:putative oxidoreductase